MSYEKYRIIQSFEEFYTSWSDDKLEDLTSEMKKGIYDRYVIRSLIFQRDNFECQDIHCKTLDSDLTLHHIKFKEDNGKYTLKNCVIICKTCHDGFHQGKNSLTFQGATYRIHKKTGTNWKVRKLEGREIRRSNIKYCGIKISLGLLSILLKWLNIHYEDMEIED